jgi:hypothetical protein
MCALCNEYGEAVNLSCTNNGTVMWCVVYGVEYTHCMLWVTVLTLWVTVMMDVRPLTPPGREKHN